MTLQKTTMSGKDLLPLISEAAFDKKAENIVVLNIKQETGIADYFVICQGDNTNHNRAIRDSIVDSLRARGVSPWHSEGEHDSHWILIDYSDVVVHIMTPQVRGYYGLEDLWKPLDGRREKGPGND
jgi:ribosome-associated protein